MRHKAFLAYFFLFPAVFAGVPAFFWHPLPRGVSLYEGVRMAYLAFGAAVFGAAFFRDVVRMLRLPLCRMLGLSSMSAHARFAAWAAIGAFAASVAYNGTDAVADIAAGRTYSAVSAASVAVLAAVVLSLPESVRQAAIRSAMLGFLAVNLPYALLQAFGFDPVTPLVVLPEWGEGRAFWTLGNPNALAFFATLCLPFVFSSFALRWRWGLVIALITVIVLSGSLSGIVVATGYLGYRGYAGLPKGFGGKYRFEVLLAVGIFILAAAPFAFPQKMLSLETRAAIVSDVAARLFENPGRFLLGGGSGSVGQWFAFERSERVSRYVDPAALIEKAHFAFLDTASAFGVPFATALFLLLIVSVWKNPERSAREALGIFLLLGCLHTPGAAEWAMAVMLLVYRTKSQRVDEYVP